MKSSWSEPSECHSDCLGSGRFDNRPLQHFVLSSWQIGPSEGCSCAHNVRGICVRHEGSCVWFSTAWNMCTCEDVIAFYCFWKRMQCSIIVKMFCEEKKIYVIFSFQQVKPEDSIILRPTTRHVFFFSSDYFLKSKNGQIQTEHKRAFLIPCRH